mmetsp:Transcript_26277/g.43589  ORF Transcript_26277/g.43589 Transcript_26277/m.43589 type:complete len:667 (-) Transcript_26277:86-2086(-)
MARKRKKPEKGTPSSGHIAVVSVGVVAVACFTVNYYLLGRREDPTPLAVLQHDKRHDTRAASRLLIDSVAAGNGASVTSLLQGGANADATSPDGWKALHIAARGGSVTATSLLLSHGADVDATHDAWTALSLAAASGHSAVVQLLLRAGADVNATSANGATALHYAAEFGHREAATALVQAGASINAKRTDGTTALHLSCEKGQATLAKSLLDYGASIDAVANNGWRPLSLAIHQVHVHLALSLLKRGASPRFAREDGTSPLHQAIELKPTASSLVASLLKHGALVNAATASGATALHRAVGVKSGLLVGMLLDAGAQTEVYTSDYRMTPLRIASELGDATSTALLLDRGASCAALDRFNHSALYVASYFGHSEVDELLRQHSNKIGARLVGSAVTDGGVAPLTAATARNSPSDKQSSLSRLTLNDLSVSVMLHGDIASAMARAVRLWRHYGIVVFPRLLASDIVQRLRRGVQEELRLSVDQTVDRSLSIRNSRFRTLRALDVTNMTSLALYEMAASLSHFLTSAFGPEQVLLESSFMLTGVGAGEQSMHSDVSQYDPMLASVQISLVDTRAEQGALEACPASHYDALHYLPDECGVVAAVPEGTVTLYSPSLIHRGRANTHVQDRLFVGLTFLGRDGVVPSGIPFVLRPHDLGRWWLTNGALFER